MTKLTHEISRLVMSALLLTVLGAGVALAQTRGYVTNFDFNSSVSVIDITTNTVIATIATGTNTISFSDQVVAFTPDGTRAYVTNQLADTVFVIDTATNTVIATIAMGPFAFPHGVAVTPDGLRVYVVNQGLGTVSVIDRATNTVIDTIPVGSNPFGIAIMPSLAPQTKDECKDGGYKKFVPPAGPFKNQGQCIKFVNDSIRGS